MTSMKDISKVCGVSIATVSKALNNHKDIGEDTKQYIRRVAKEMGYYPNSSARALKTQRTYNLGVLFADEAGSGLTHDYFVNILEAFKRTVEEKGYDITFINTGAQTRSYLEHCRYRDFDGVAVVCVDFYDRQVEELVHSDIPIVTVDHFFPGRAAVISDNVRGMRDLLTYVHSRGHRRIAYIHGADSHVTRNRLTSFFNTAEELGLNIPDAYIKEAAYRDTDGAGRATEELLGVSKPPTCILYPDDFSCFGGMNAIRKRGLRIPEDISVAGYDGIRAGRHIEPCLTTLVQDTERIGARVGEKLISLIEKPRSTIIEQIVIDGRVYEGRTVGRV